MGQILGEVTIRVNGKQIKTKGGSTLDPGGNDWTQHVGPGVVWGESKKYLPPKIENLSIAADEDVDIISIKSISNAQLVWEGDNGVSYMMTGCVCGQATLNEESGDIKTSFMGRKIVRI
ncbi:phage tail tube protein [Aeromonas piscicola]|uniref:Phage tail tube protein n=1 Tax=Aeromonas piscicola TaxID=600645 RepID=A0ABT7QGH5_9GAMM|nr:phage tail tube protein [Aeromonas piscicola]MDM5132908.1 phage tail tube protein [Aeromonas piscicola]